MEAVLAEARYPWLGGHGSIEGCTGRRAGSRQTSRIHGWEVMAPLKDRSGVRSGCSQGSIHGWEVMAPLKAGERPDGDPPAHCIHGWEVMAPLKDD